METVQEKLNQLRKRLDHEEDAIYFDAALDLLAGEIETQNERLRKIEEKLSI